MSEYRASLDAVTFAVRATVAEIDSSVSLWMDTGAFVRVVRGDHMRTLPNFYSEMSAAYQFPLRFRPRAHELLLGLESLDLSSARAHILVITESGRLLEKEEKSTERLSALFDVLLSAKEYWEAPRAVVSSPSLPDRRPFHILFVQSIDQFSNARIASVWRGLNATLVADISLSDPGLRDHYATNANGNYKRPIVATAMAAMAVSAGFTSLAGSWWKSKSDVACMLHFEDVSDDAAAMIYVGLWFPTLADGGLPDDWRSCHLLTTVARLDEAAAKDVARLFDSASSISVADRLSGVGDLLGYLVLPLLDSFENAEDLRRGGKAHSLVSRFSISPTALAFLDA